MSLREKFHTLWKRAMEAWERPVEALDLFGPMTWSLQWKNEPAHLPASKNAAQQPPGRELMPR